MGLAPNGRTVEAWMIPAAPRRYPPSLAPFLKQTSLRVAVVSVAANDSPVSHMRDRFSPDDRSKMLQKLYGSVYYPFGAAGPA